jgi:oligopeptide/dipeptide ABC transporter ATP-binding protein
MTVTARPAAALLAVESLHVVFTSRSGEVYAVNDISFDVRPGEVVGIVGESGCGKTVTGLAVMRLLPPTTRIAGRVRFEGRDLLGLSEREMRRIRGDKIGLIFQEPTASLNPSLSIGTQLVESIRAHRSVPARVARNMAEEMLGSVGIADGGAILARYPHEVSGGMAQRVLIASALAPAPSLLIADEPTTALDVSTQADVLKVLAERTRELGTAVLLITHDMGVVARATDRTIVMYGGCIVESGRTSDVLKRPQHPYTGGLLASTPRLLSDGGRLIPIEGYPAIQREAPIGCPFAPRCPMKLAVCERERPDLTSSTLDSTDVAHEFACHNPLHIPVSSGLAPTSQ